MSSLTLEKVAELAGVSRSTVSRVVNGQTGVKADVRERVLGVIERTGYQPNMAARALAAGRAGSIGLVIPSAVASLFADPYFPRLIQGISQGSNANDLTLALFIFHNEAEEEKLNGRLHNTGFLDGVIIASSHFDDPLIPHLLESGTPFLVVGRQDQYPQASFIDVDNVRGAYAATSHLLRLGYRRVAHIAGPQDMVAGVDRLEGYQTALADKGRAVEPALVAHSDFSQAGGYVAMQQLLRHADSRDADHRPDAVFVASDQMALGAWQAIRESGLDVPRDIALVGYDDLLPADADKPRLTTIRQPVRRTGAAAVDVLMDIIENGTAPPRRVILDTQLVIRESCGAILR
jgi:LacI family transcriptional regulator